MVEKYLEMFNETQENGSLMPHRIEIAIQDDSSNKLIEVKGSDLSNTSSAIKQIAEKFEKNGKKIYKKRSQKSIINNHKLTDFFPVRRSIRKCFRTVLEEKRIDIENKIRSGSQDGLEVQSFKCKGRGIVTTRKFSKGEFVVEYCGELIEQAEAKKRETKYAKDQNTGCYMYYFRYKNSQYCVDATLESKKFGRLVNHSRNGNLITRIVEVDNIPHLVLIAKDDIPAGYEVTYDYGDRNKDSLINHPWLAY